MILFSSVKCSIGGDAINLAFTTPDPTGRSDKIFRTITLRDAEELSKELLEQVKKAKQLRQNHKKERLAKLKAEFQVLALEIKELEDSDNHGK